MVYYEYDYKRRPTKVTVNGTTTEYAYDDENGITAATFAGHTFTTKKNKDGNVIKTEADGAVQLEYTYANGLLKSIDDNVTKVKSTYEYAEDNTHKLKKVTNGMLNEDYAYNERGELGSKSYTGEANQTYTYFYKNNAARDLDYIVLPDGLKTYAKTDVNGRNTGKELYNGENKVYGEYITYRKVGDHATNMPSAIWYANGNEIKDNIKYKYDSCGNISEITENGRLSVRYKYDSLNRLVREDNKKFNKTWLYTYDNCGNITSKKTYGFTLRATELLAELEITEENTYVYEGDRLTSYNGQKIGYDGNGNPEIYKGETLEWEYGKRLKKYGGKTFIYDGFGRRKSKGDITYTYDSAGNLIKQSDGIAFIYDGNGLSGFNRDGINYIYRKNVQGDITAILDTNGNILAEYVYDAWGNYAVNGDETLAEFNPFRYRGYYYDTETGLYYLKTRYYDPEVGRFISQDDVSYLDPETINGLNLYAYCGNNPVMNVDPTGRIALSIIFVSMLIGAAIGGTVAAVKAINAELDAGGVFLAVLGGVVMGAAVSGAFALGGAAVTGLTVLGQAVSISGFSLFAIASFGTAAAGAINYICTSVAYNSPISGEGIYVSAFDGFIEGSVSFIAGAIAGSKGYFKNVEKSIFKSSKIMETISRAVKFSLPSIIIRNLFKGFIQYNWEIDW